MNDSGNKENQINSRASERIPFSVIKVSKTVVSPATQSINISGNNINNNIYNITQLNEANKKILQLQQKLKESETEINKVKQENQNIIDSQSQIKKLNITINNNRIRRIQKLSQENENYKTIITQQKQQSNDKISIKQNNNRIRAIQRLKIENEQLKQLLQQQEQQQLHVQPTPPTIKLPKIESMSIKDDYKKNNYNIKIIEEYTGEC